VTNADTGQKIKPEAGGVVRVAEEEGRIRLLVADRVTTDIAGVLLTPSEAHTLHLLLQGEAYRHMLKAMTRSEAVGPVSFDAK
jgi:hypothetical protein